jgi:ElaB/YqjD/DUF883 family membrane-anchored ribosome-binding protein
MADNSFSQDRTSAPGDVKGKIHEAVSSVAQKAQRMASAVSEKTKESTSAALDKTDGALSAVGHQLNALAGTVRGMTPQEGVIGTARTAVADNLQAGGHYLEEHGMQDIGKDLTEVIRHHPISSVLAGFGLGCLLGITLSRR